MNPEQIIDKYYPPGPLRDILLIHSECVADKALAAARRSGLPFDADLLEAGAMLHDIGIFLCDAPGIECHGSEPYIRHGLLGGQLLRKEGYPDLARFCERHTGAGLTREDIIQQRLPLPAEDFLPETIEEKAVCYADKFFSKSAPKNFLPSPALSPEEAHLAMLEAISREKSFDRVRASMARHGSSTISRFMALHHLFNPETTDMDNPSIV